MKCFLNKSSILLVVLLLFSAAAMAQFTVTGTVKDASDQPLIGVSIVEKGTTRGTVTDFDGNFTLAIEGQSAVLMFSYTGFKTKEVEVSPSSNVLTVTLDEDIARLEEIVVTGLASGVKRSNSGVAVTSISGEELSDQTNPQTLDYALYGKIPGVQMTASDGAPGGGISVQLRGISTLGAGSSQPLYIIDGVYVDNSSIRNGRTQVSGAGGGSSGSNQDNSANRIADINPDDIERIEVLKGPSAAAIYGTRANAGVIIITTKRGAAGATKVSLNQDVGFAQGQNFQNFDEWNEEKIRYYYSGDRVNKEIEAYQQAVAAGRITDWEEFFYGDTGFLSNTQVNVSGGSQKTQFYVSGGLQTEEGIIKRTGYDRYTLRANIEHELTQGIRISFNNNYVRSQSQRGFTGNQNNTGGSIGYNLAYTPTYANLFPDENGNYPDSDYFNDNPIAIRDLAVNDEDVDRFISALNLDIDLFQTTNSYLKLKINGGVDYLSGNTLVYFPEVLQHQRAQANPGDVMWGRQDNLNTNIQAFLTFNTNLGTINSNTTLGAVRLDQQSEYQLSRGQGLSGGQRNLAWASVVSIPQQGQINQQTTDIGLVAQQDFNWEDKLIASLGVRFDKSSLNRDQDKFYAFPKASLAANLGNFDFWTIKDVVNQLKLRVAYGETGGLPLYGRTFEVLGSQVIGGFLGGLVGGQNFAVPRGVDPNLKPETAAELEFGVDASFFNSRITLEATYYNKEVRDLILDLQPAESTGISAIATNAADLENRGLELGLGVNPIRSTNVNWFAKVLYWHNRSEITRLDIPTFTTGGFGPALGTYLIAEGYSPTTIVGNPAGTDIPGGRTVYGDRQPDFQMSFLSQLNFLKSFDFNFLFHYQNGGEAINLSAFLWDDGGTSPGWFNTVEGDPNVRQGQVRINEWAGGNTGVWIEETSYLKLREISLYYTLPNALFNNLIKRAKIGVSANNVLLWTSYGSYDPEVSNFGAQPVSGSVEVTPYPTSRRLFFHLKLDF